MKRSLRFFPVFFAIVLLIIPFCGCDRPEVDPVQYGEILDKIPDVPGAEEEFAIPEVEGVDHDEIHRHAH